MDQYIDFTYNFNLQTQFTITKLFLIIFNLNNPLFQQIKTTPIKKIIQNIQKINLKASSQPKKISKKLFFRKN